MKTLTTLLIILLAIVLLIVISIIVIKGNKWSRNLDRKIDQIFEDEHKNIE